MQDPGETDVDCGGPTCSPCDVDRQCVLARDCQTGSCQASFCALVTAGPGEPGPGWRVVGTFNLGSQATLTSGRRSVGLARSGSRFYVAGGYITLIPGGQERVTNQLLTLDLPQSGLTGAVGMSVFNTPMTFSRGGPTAAMSPSGTLFVFGGASGIGTAITSVEIYAPQTGDGGTWTLGTPLPSSAFTDATAVPLGDGGVLLVAAGQGLKRFGFGSTYADAGPVAPANARAVALHPNGDLYVFASDSAGFRNTVRLRPGATAFTAMPPSLGSHPTAGAIFAPDGRFYVVDSNAEAFSPNGDWAPVATPAHGHDFGAVALAADGRVVVFFGSSTRPGNEMGYATVAEAYGPVFSVTASSGQAGDRLRVTGENFAANARVRVLLGPADGGVLLTEFQSSDAGTFTNVLITVPDAGAGPLTAIDSRARYPVTHPFTRL